MPVGKFSYLRTHVRRSLKVTALLLIFQENSNFLWTQIACKLLKLQKWPRIRWKGIENKWLIIFVQLVVLEVLPFKFKKKWEHFRARNQHVFGRVFRHVSGMFSDTFFMKYTPFEPDYYGHMSVDCPKVSICVTRCPYVSLFVRRKFC